MALTDLIIVGAGPAGLTAALYARRAQKSVLLFEKAVPGGQMVNTPEVENYPACGSIAGWELASRLTEQVSALGVTPRSEEVIRMEKDKNGFTVFTETDAYPCRAVILAGGALRRKLGIPGEEAFAGRGVSYCATCDGAFFRGRPVAVVGGGNTALEDALYLADLCPDVHLIHRRDNFRAQAILVDRVRARSNIHTHMGVVPVSIEGGQKVNRLVLEDANGLPREALSVDAVFVAVGLSPDNARFSPPVALDPQGYIIASEDCHTSTPGIFAAGDTRTKALRQIVTAAADGAVAATAAIAFLDGGGCRA